MKKKNKEERTHGLAIGLCSLWSMTDVSKPPVPINPPSFHKQILPVFLNAEP